MFAADCYPFAFYHYFTIVAFRVVNFASDNYNSLHTCSVHNCTIQICCLEKERWNNKAILKTKYKINKDRKPNTYSFAPFPGLTFDAMARSENVGIGTPDPLRILVLCASFKCDHALKCILPYGTSFVYILCAAEWISPGEPADNRTRANL